MNLIFAFDEKKEISDLLDIYYPIFDFLKKKNYKVFFPKVSKKLERKLISSPDDVREEFRLEFSPIYKSEKQIYTETLDTVKKNWSVIEKDFFSLLSKMNLSLPKYITCYVSRYGPGGSFNFPSDISIRVVREFEPDILNSNEKIVHELVHLAVYELATANNFDFEDTERLVDLVLTKTPIAKLLNHPKLQGFGDSNLDNMFNLYKNDIPKAILRFKGKE